MIGSLFFLFSVCVVKRFQLIACHWNKCRMHTCWPCIAKMYQENLENSDLWLEHQRNKRKLQRERRLQRQSIQKRVEERIQKLSSSAQSAPDRTTSSNCTTTIPQNNLIDCTTDSSPSPAKRKHNESPAATHPKRATHTTVTPSNCNAPLSLPTATAIPIATTVPVLPKTIEDLWLRLAAQPCDGLPRAPECECPNCPYKCHPLIC